MENPLVQNILLFNRLSQYPAEQIYNIIKDETPQTIAVIVSRLKSDKARDVLEFFPSADQKDIVFRMASAKNIPSEMLNEVANVIGERLKYLDRDEGKASLDGQQRMAEILKHMSPDKAKSVLDALGKKDMGLSDRVNRKVFTFEDIANVEIKGLQHALARVEIETLAMALKGADDGIKTAVWGALSENRRKILRDEMKYLGPRTKSEIERARTDLMSILRGFFDQGILRGKDDPSADEWV
ncbi:FliG C-terminal domain-containing protein [candidate division KSB1 bacterium]